MRKTFEINGEYVKLVYDTETEELSLCYRVSAEDTDIWLPESRVKEILEWLERAKRE